MRAIRAHVDLSQWISSNFMGFFPGFDHYVICRSLLASWDHYIGCGHLDLDRAGAIHDLTRGFKRRNFWVMETQPGCVNWSPINNVLDRGEGRAMAWNGIGHGADAILYWQWRSALGGQEQYHGTLVGPDGKPRPFYREVRDLADDLGRVGDLLDGHSVEAEVALLHSYDDRWAIDGQRHHRDFDPVEHLLHYHRALSSRSIATDVVSTRAALVDRGYRLVIAAPVHIVDDDLAAELVAFVRQGGHLVPRCGAASRTLTCAAEPPPPTGALLQEAAGMHVEEYYALRDPVGVTLSFGGAAHEGHARIWAEWLAPGEGTDVLGHYAPSNGWLDGQAAVTMHRYGRGRVYYVGAWLDEDLQEALIGWISHEAGVEPALAGLPLSVRATRRGNAYVLINGGREAVSVSLPWSGIDHLTGNESEEIALEAYGVAVVTQAKAQSA